MKVKNDCRSKFSTWIEAIEKKKPEKIRENLLGWLFFTFIYNRSWLYLGVKTNEVFLCFVAIVRVYYVDFFVFFVVRHWWVSQVFTPRMSPAVQIWIISYIPHVVTHLTGKYELNKFSYFLLVGRYNKTLKVPLTPNFFSFYFQKEYKIGED